jgi:hypothetical protein
LIVSVQTRRLPIFRLIIIKQVYIVVGGKNSALNVIWLLEKVLSLGVVVAI